MRTKRCLTPENLIKNVTANTFLAAVIACGIVPAFAQQNQAVQSQASEQVQTEAQRVYGWELMTDEERQAHRQKKRSLQTREERQQYRQEHHAKMQQRAKEKGVTLPDAPRAKPGMGQGRNKPGMRQGGGPGRGMRAGRNMPAFADFDLNSDGHIAEQEFTDARNKRMEQRAAEGRPMRNLGKAPAFNEIDTDSDGKVSTDEFSAHQTARMQEKRSRQ